MSLPSFFLPRWTPTLPAIGGWANLPRALNPSNPNGIIAVPQLLSILSNPANNPINLPSGATFYGLILPGGGYSGANNTLLPNQRLIAVPMCFCNNHVPGAASNHRYGTTFYLVTDPLPSGPPRGTIDDDFDLTVEEPRSPEPTYKCEDFFPDCEPKKKPPIGLILFIVSSAVSLAGNLSRSKALWGNIYYGSAGNMLGSSDPIDIGDMTREIGLHNPNTNNDFVNYFNFSSWTEPLGIRNLPCFDWSPLPKYDAVKLNTSFVAWATLNLNAFRGLFEEPLPNQFMYTLGRAILGLDVAGAARLLDFNNYRALFSQWQAQIREIAELNGYEIVSNNKDRTDPNKHTINSFYLEFRVSLSLPERPSPPTDGFAFQSSPLYHWLQKLYDTKYPNNSIEFIDGNYFVENMKIYNHAFLGIDFLNCNAVVDFKKDGLWYEYTFADSVFLRVKGELTEEIINSCYADHPAKNDLLFHVKRFPIKIIYPENTHPFNNKTNPFSCWGISPDWNKQNYLPLSTTPPTTTVGWPVAELGIGEVIDVFTHFVSREFEAQLEVPGVFENGSIITIKTQPVVLIPNSYYSGLADNALAQMKPEEIIENSINIATQFLGYASISLPPLEVIQAVIESARIIQSIVNLSSGELSKHQRHNGFIYQKGKVGYPSKFRVCRNDVTLPTPVDNSVRVPDYPNDKSKVLLSKEFQTISSFDPPPSGWEFERDNPDGTTTYSRITTVPYDQEVSPIKNITSGLGVFKE